MKKTHYIILFAVLAIAGFLIYFNEKKKKNPNSKIMDIFSNDNNINNENYTLDNNINNGNQQVINRKAGQGKREQFIITTNAPLVQPTRAAGQGKRNNWEVAENTMTAEQAAEHIRQIELNS